MELNFNELNELKTEIKSDFPDIWSPEKEGDELAGFYLGKEGPLPPNDSYIHKFQISKDEVLAMWDSVQLSKLLDQIEVNQAVKVVFKGTQQIKNSENSFKKFVLFT